MENVNKVLGIEENPDLTPETNNDKRTDESFLKTAAYFILGTGVIAFIKLLSVALEFESRLFFYYSIGSIVSSFGTYALFKVIANISNSLKEIASTNRSKIKLISVL